MRPVVTRRPPEAFQSPLHRGILCNCTRIMISPTSTPLSVPSSSGNTLQLPPRNREKYLRSSFSPLFIGEYSATALADTDDQPSISFSPLFIGEYSATGECALL